MVALDGTSILGGLEEVGGDACGGAVGTGPPCCVMTGDLDGDDDTVDGDSLDAIFVGERVDVDDTGSEAPMGTGGLTDPTETGPPTPDPMGTGVITGDPMGTGFLAPVPLGTGVITGDPMGTGFLAPVPMGTGVITGDPMGTGFLAPDPMGTGVVTGDPLAPDPIGTGVITGDPMGTGVVTGDPMGTGALAGSPVGEIVGDPGIIGAFDAAMVKALVGGTVGVPEGLALTTGAFVGFNIIFIFPRERKKVSILP